MSYVEKLQIRCSWLIQGDICSIVETRSRYSPALSTFELYSNGALLDPDTKSASSRVIVQQPQDGPTTCQLHLDTTKLAGYYLHSVTVTSEARNMEVYDDSGEYLGTAGRSLVENTSHQETLFCCSFDLDDDLVTNKLSLKLLSLRGKDQFVVTSLSVGLMENYGVGESSGEKEMSRQWSTQLIQQSVHDLPPFLHTLVNNLHDQPPAGAQDPSEMPCDVMKLLTILKGARQAKEEEEEKRKAQELLVQEANKIKPEDTVEEATPVTQEETCNSPLGELEVKLKQFVVDQLSKLEQKIEGKLNELLERVENLELNCNSKS